MIPSLQLTAKSFEQVTKGSLPKCHPLSGAFALDSGATLSKSPTKFYALKVLLFNDSLVEFRGTLRDLCGPAAMRFALADAMTKFALQQGSKSAYALLV